MGISRGETHEYVAMIISTYQSREDGEKVTD